MNKEAINTAHAPPAVGPYSQAVRSSDLVFLSGQIPLDPATKALVPGDIKAQTRQVMTNLAAVLDAAGGTFEQVLKTTIYLVDMNEFSMMNEVYASFFDGTPPARATVCVAALPLGARVEIDAVARIA